MRWIKKFEASGSSLRVRDELKEFCEINLAYLMDDDYNVMITRRDSLPIESEYHKRGYVIHFYKWQFDDEVDFKWNEVEDHFIPFVQRLSKEYTVVECIMDTINENGVQTRNKVSIVLNDDLPKERLLLFPVFDLQLLYSLSIERILIIVSEE